MIQPDCGCGCGAKTKGGKWLPGHDARFVAASVKIARGLILSAATNSAPEIRAHVVEKGSEALVAKYDKALAQALEVAERPARTRKPRVTKPGSLARADALIELMNAQYWTGQKGQVKEGGHWHPAKVMRRNPDDTLFVRMTHPVDGSRVDLESVPKKDFKRNWVDE